MEGFPSGQREQTVNLSSMTSVVRIHHLPPKEPILIRVSVLFWCQVEWIRKPALRNVPVARFNRRGLPVGRQPLKYSMVAPQKSESTTGWGGRRVAGTPWAEPERNGGHIPHPEGRNDRRTPHKEGFQRQIALSIHLHNVTANRRADCPQSAAANGLPA